MSRMAKKTKMAKLSSMAQKQERLKWPERKKN